MKKVLVVIAGDLYVRNYVDSGALQELADGYELHFLIRDDVKQSKRLASEKPHCTEYVYSVRDEKVGQLVFDVLMLRFAAKSPSFAFRTRRVLPSLFEHLRARKPLHKYFWILLRKFYLPLLSSNLLFGSFKKAFIDKLRINTSLAEAVAAHDPDLVIFPSSAYNIDGIDLVKICRNKGISTLFLIDNWDNLSSKSMLWERPAHIAVWGEQSREHAVDIQGFDRRSVSLIGTPRFDGYFEARRRDIPSHFDFPYVLFVGTALPFDEANALKSLCEELTQHPEIYGDLKIVYRPHPWRQGKDSILGMNLERVVIDPQMAENYSKKGISRGFQPSLDYYPGLLSNAEMVLGGITSMLIESVIFWKKYLVLAYDEPGNLSSPKNVFESYVHFRGIEHLSTVRFCNEVGDLKTAFRRLYQEQLTKSGEELDRERQYFLYSDERAYSQRLRSLVDSLFD